MHVFFLAAIFLFGLAGPAQAKIVGKEISYKDGDTTLKGYIAYDDSIKGKRPGILVVHEWWGNNAYSRMRADMLAGLGYTALALDMFGNGLNADNPDDAGKLAGGIYSNLPLMRSRFLAARSELNKQQTVDPKRNAAVGYCFGGGVVLELALEGIDLNGVAGFHAGLGGKSAAEPGKVKAKVLLLNGADDKFNSPETIAALRKNMDDAKVDYRYLDYPGAVHAFSNPNATALGKKFNIPIAYNEKADKASWEEMRKFFAELFPR